MRPLTETVGVLLQSESECRQIVTALYEQVSLCTQLSSEHSEYVARIYEAVASGKIQGNVVLTEKEVALSSLGLMSQANHLERYFLNPATACLAIFAIGAEYAYKSYVVHKLKSTLHQSVIAVFDKSIPASQQPET